MNRLARLEWNSGAKYPRRNGDGRLSPRSPNARDLGHPAAESNSVGSGAANVIQSRTRLRVNSGTSIASKRSWKGLVGLPGPQMRGTWGTRSAVRWIPRSPSARDLGHPAEFVRGVDREVHATAGREAGATCSSRSTRKMGRPECREVDSQVPKCGGPGAPAASFRGRLIRLQWLRPALVQDALLSSEGRAIPAMNRRAGKRNL